MFLMPFGNVKYICYLDQDTVFTEPLTAALYRQGACFGTEAYGETADQRHLS